MAAMGIEGVQARAALCVRRLRVLPRARARARARACVYDPWCMRAPAGEGSCTCEGFRKFGGCKHQAATVTAANAAGPARIRERMARLRDGLALDGKEALIERLVELARRDPSLLAALEGR